ncbi:MAG TPA: hypothetical protein DDZ88_18605 [Verrucomicrobiales bacterium]|nr:hypothetical protein [Verrucomicrobiales bacterium]
MRVNEHIACDAAFGIGHAGVERALGAGAAHIVGHLAVEVTHAVVAGEAELGAGGEIHGGSVLGDVFEGVSSHAA